MRRARVSAQAKVNLWLEVGEPDGRGYHKIGTLFQRIDLADEIIVRTSNEESRTLVCGGPLLPAGGLGPGKKNLAYRAAEEYSAHTGWPRGFAIEVTKHIPVGGGLGGGSSDAGAVLRALNALAPAPLDPDALHAIAAKLGADVAFLASEHVRAIGRGRGDQLVPFPLPLPDADVLLVVPSFGISTADAYRWIDAANRPPKSPGASPTGLQYSGSPWTAFGLRNDFEPVVEARHPELRAFRERLTAAGATLARLSGSGSTVFGVFEGRAPAPDALGLDALVIATRTASRVVQVEVLE